MNDADLFRDAVKAFIAARDAGCPLHDCVRAVLDVAESQSDSLSGAGMEIVSLVEAKPGEPGPEIDLKMPDDQTWTLETVALTPASSSPRTRAAMGLSPRTPVAITSG
jgi:hypothetical protein